MLFRIIGKEIATHRQVEISNWDAPDIATAHQFATEIGINVTRIEPMIVLDPNSSSGEYYENNDAAVYNIILKGSKLPTTIAVTFRVCLVLLALVLICVGEAISAVAPLSDWQKCPFEQVDVNAVVGDSHTIVAKSYGDPEELLF